MLILAKGGKARYSKNNLKEKNCKERYSRQRQWDFSHNN